MGSTENSFLIIGAGIYGISTALELKKSKPSSSVRLLDRTGAPCPSAASHDLNKIVRADYDDVFYMRLGLEAMHGWRTDETYSPFYHESGILIVDDSGWGAKCLENYKLLNIIVKAEILSTEAAQTRFPMFADGNWDGATDCYWNPESGWAEAEKALSSGLKAAVDAGVEILEAAVDKLLLDNQGRCTGAVATDGTEFHASQTLVCAGAYTPKILLDTFPHSKECQVGDRLVAAGAVSCTASFAAADDGKVAQVPVLINTLPHTHGESIPPVNGRTLKFNNETSFTCNTTHEASGQTISIPPPQVSQSTWTQDVPRTLKSEAQTVMRHTYGEHLQELKAEEYRMCWDAVTPDQDWLISPHPKCDNLYIAAGGSFHGWKFFPCIGKYVTKMLLGNLDEEKARRWAWDRNYNGGRCPMYIPKRDLKDL
ncbi:hypothetical protein LTS15_006660 [Exophiala xenobiotica]|nr:hypothetical protein LTS15_006660 [Exophiala xenobiotica]